MKVEHSNNVKVLIDISFITIYINDLIHFTIRRDPLIAIQSYKNGHLSYKIEYETNEKTIVTEYNNKEIWEAILKGLGEYHLF